MRKHKYLMASLALCLVLTVAAVPALAYFTDHTEADGKVEVTLGFKTELTEQVEGTVKTVTITNNEDSNEACWVRAKAIAGGGVELSYSGDNWATEPDADGWYVYQAVLDPGDTTSSLTINITPPEDAKEGDEINVAVVYESTKVLYNEDGTPMDPDWNMMGIEEGSGE